MQGIMKKIGLIVLAWISTSMLALVLREMTIPVYSMVYLFIFMLEYAGLMKVNVYYHFEKNDWSGTFFSFLFGFMTLLGFFLGRQMNIGPRRMLISTVAAVGLTPIVYGVIYSNLVAFFQKVAVRADIGYKLSDRKFYLICMGILIIAWIPVWLAFYPGIWGYDVPAQMPQQIGTYTTHHPLLHTLLLQKFYKIGIALGSANTGVALYTIFQMIVFASSLAYMILFLYRMKIRRKYLIVIMAFEALSPIYSILAITATKDILFCSMFIFAFTIMGYFAENENQICDRRKQIGFVIVLSLCGLLRNNAIYVIIILFIYAAVYYRHRVLFMKTLIMEGIAVIAIMAAANGMLVTVTHASSGSKNEMLSVPYQQMARVYNMDQNKLTQLQKKQIKMIMPNVDAYAPNIADHVKEDATGPIHIKDMSKLYIQLLWKFPLRYLEAVLLNTQGYWYVDDISCSQLYGPTDAQNVVGYLWMYIWGHMGVEPDSKLPLLRELYVRGFGGNAYQKVPILACLFNYGLYLWSILICLAYAIHNKIRKYNLLLFFVLILLGTYLLGPAACVRYVLPFIACLPVLVMMIFSGQTDQQEQKING